MIRPVYDAIVHLYPSEYRQVFASEMLQTFDEANEASRKQSRPKRILFALCEVRGVLCGLPVEWWTKWSEKDRYLTSSSSTDIAADVPEDIEALQSRLKNLIRCMEYAIAHHNFPKARFYSNEERITRALLNRLQASPSNNI